MPTTVRKQAKKTRRKVVDKPAATQDPNRVAATIAGVTPRQISQRTPPRALWARTLEIEVKTMAANEVPTERCCT